MKYLLRISHEAYVDLRTATDYIADDAPARAERFASEFFEIANKLCQFPKLGRLRDELNTGYP
jgi:plasmid stabilization system protein ParE